MYSKNPPDHFFKRTPRFSRPLLLAAFTITLTSAVATAITVTPDATQHTTQTVVESLRLSTPTIVDHSDDLFFAEATIERGDTMQKLLARLLINDDEAHAFLRTAEATRPMRQEFNAGRSVSARVNGQGQLQDLFFPLADRESILKIERNATGLSAKVLAERPETYITTRSATIQHSLFGATDAAGIPDNIALQLAEIFGSQIDFHRDLRKGDHFTVSYEMHFLNGLPTQSGRIVAAEFVNDGQHHQASWFAHNANDGEYLTPDGKPLKKAFLRSPLAFSRISSGFSQRFHPILKTWRAHRGVDYAAPSGTPIRATANGTIDFVGNQSGYGNTVVLKHDGKYSTLYAHLSRFGDGLRKGQRVRQGDIIGHVGQTGWATGPHLHYEFKISGTAVDPLSAEIPVASANLTREQMTRFKAESQQQWAMLAQLRGSEILYTR